MFNLQGRYFMRLASIVIVMSVFLTQPVAAQLDDPTLPPNVSNVAVSKGKDAVIWTLSSILVSPQRNIAIVNGHSVQVGDTVAGAKVQSINKTVVKLKHRGEVVRLELYPVTVKTVRER